MALGLVVLLAQLAVWSYGRSAVRAALDEGARTGARVADSVERCEQRAVETLGALLGGRMGREVALGCATDGERVLARAEVRFGAFAPAMGDWAFEATATARRSPEP